MTIQELIDAGYDLNAEIILDNPDELYFYSLTVKYETEDKKTIVVTYDEVFE